MTGAEKKIREKSEHGLKRAGRSVRIGRSIRGAGERT